MRCRSPGYGLILLALAGPALGFEVVAVIRSINLEERVLVVVANGREHTVRVAEQSDFLDQKGAPLGAGLSSKEFTVGATVTLRVESVDRRPTILSMRLGGAVAEPLRRGEPGAASVGQTSVGFKPLSEMTAEDRYQGEDGGLYGGGSNQPPAELAARAQAETRKIQPLDARGKPAAEGRIGLISLSMSNATQEFSRFKQLSDSDPRKSPRVTVVDCAQGGQTMARWADPQAACWTEAEQRLENAGVSPEQVQVAWIKLANAGPQGDLSAHGRQLERDTRAVLANAKRRYPHLRIAYLGSRIYGGYADGRLNPEPYAYEGAFVVRWLIQSQWRTDSNPEASAARDAADAPLLLWGPYLWGDGLTPRQTDGLIWERTDFAGDGTHPSNSGRQKVAEQLLQFFQSDVNTKTWYLQPE